MMTTVVPSPAQVLAFDEWSFVAYTVYVVEEDRARAVAKEGLGLGRESRTAAKLPTHHMGIVHVPPIVTYCPPYIVVKDLYTTLAITDLAHQPNSGRTCTEAEIK